MKPVTEQSVRFSAEEQIPTRIVYGNRGIDGLAQQLYSATMDECTRGGFPNWLELPDRCKEHWRVKARQQLDHMIQFLKSEVVTVPEELAKPTEEQIRTFKEYERAMREEVVPEIIKETQERAILADKARQWRVF